MQTEERDVGGLLTAGPAHRRKTPERASWWTQRNRSLVLIGVVVVLANATYLIHVFNPNPINQVSDIGTAFQFGPSPGYDNIDPNIGWIAQALGHRAAVDWLHGSIPWWNPNEGVGSPLAGEMQSAALFPPVILDLFSNGQVYFRIFLECAAGISAYLLLRRFTRSNTPALVGGVAFALNGTFSWLFHAPGNPVAFLPLVLLGLEQVRDRAVNGQSRHGWVVVAVGLALSLYAGFPEVAFIDGLLILLWALVRAIGLSRRQLLDFGKNALLGVVAGLLLAAPIIVAFVDYLPLADIGGHTGQFASGFLSPGEALPMQIMPYLFGPIFGFSGNVTSLTVVWSNIGGYFGISLTVFALIGTCGRRYRPLRIGLAAWTVVGLARLVGVGWALSLVNVIPGVSATAFYRYASPAWEMAVIVLATLGIDDVVHRVASRWVVLASGAVALGACLLSWHAAEPVLRTMSHDAPASRGWSAASLIWAFVMIVAIVTLALLPDVRIAGYPGSLKPAAIALLVMFDVVVMFATPQFSAPHSATIDTKVVSYLEEHLGANRFYTLGPIVPNYGSYFGLSELAVNDVPVPKTFEKFVVRNLDPNVDATAFSGNSQLHVTGPSAAQELIAHLAAYESVGVKYVVTFPGEKLPAYRGAPLKEVYADGIADIVELPHPAPLFEASDRRCVVRALNGTTATVNCKSPSTLLYRELYMPGWNVRVNGRAASTTPSGPLFQSVDVPAGASIVQFAFTPRHEDAAFAAVLLGLVLMALHYVRPKLAPARRARRGARAKNVDPADVNQA